MNNLPEYIVKADSILTEKGFEADRGLRIRDGRIVDIGDISIFAGSIKLLNFTSYTVTPCFCDYHLHLIKKEGAKQDDVIKALNNHGITKIYDGGSQDLYLSESKDRIENSMEIKLAGQAIYKKGSYGKYIGHGVETVRDAEQLIDKLLEAGADYVKIINSGIYNPDNNKISEGGFSPNDLRTIVDYAKSGGLDVACHANGEQAVEDAVNSGVSYLIHGLEASDKSLSNMAGQGIVIIPTINAFASLNKISKSKESYDNVEKTVVKHIQTVSRAYDKGVKVLPGSDAGPDFIPYGSSYKYELLLFQKAGISYEDILLSAIAGHFEVGEQADFLVLDGLDVKKVFIRGICIADNT